MRICPSKKEGIIVDFCGNIKEFGSIEDWIWEMDGIGSKNCLLLPDGGQLNLRSLKTKRIHVCCKNCNHVYDIQKYFKCNNCNEVNSVEVKTTVSDLKEWFVAQIGEMTWKKFIKSPMSGIKNEKEAFQALLDIVTRVVKSNSLPMKDKFNTMYLEIFDGDDFKPEFRWFSQLVGKKVHYKDVVHFNI